MNQESYKFDVREIGDARLQILDVPRTVDLRQDSGRKTAASSVAAAGTLLLIHAQALLESLTDANS